jgi:hypothetical protein
MGKNHVFSFVVTVALTVAFTKKNSCIYSDMTVVKNELL